MKAESNIGVTQDEANREETRFDANIIPINKPGRYIIHPMGKLKRWVRRWVPILKFNSQTGAAEPSFTLITGESNFLEEIVKVDEESRFKYFIATQKMEGRQIDEERAREEARSRLSAISSWLLLAFDMADPEPVVKKINCTWTVWKGLRELQESPSATKPGMLMFGPIYAFQAMINHIRDDQKPGAEYMKHDYKVSIYDAPLRDQLPLSLLNERPSAEIINMCFSAEELAAIEQSDIDLDVDVKAVTNDDIVEIFKKTPLNLGAMDDKRLPFFMNPEALIPILEENQVSYELTSLARHSTQQLPPAKGAAPRAAAPEVAQPTKPDEVVEDAAPAATSPTSEDEFDNAEELGWESEDEMFKVIQAFSPKGLQVTMFKRWQRNDGSKDGFEKMFPGVIDEALTESSQVEPPPKETKSPKRHSQKPAPAKSGKPSDRW